MFKIKKLRENAKLPQKATAGSAGYDLYAAIDAPIEILPGQTKPIATGIAMQIPPQYAGFVFARSGLGIKHGIVPANCVGVIDSDYRGELIVGLHNLSQIPFTIKPNDRVAQLVLMPVYTPELTQAQELDDSIRGAGGFGSTGR